MAFLLLAARRRVPFYETFYVLAVYFGSVGIRKTRHALACGLTAELAGFLGAVAVSYLFFG